jgi:hypothetical protein
MIDDGMLDECAVLSWMMRQHLWYELYVPDYRSGLDGGQ